MRCFRVELKYKRLLDRIRSTYYAFRSSCLMVIPTHDHTTIYWVWFVRYILCHNMSSRHDVVFCSQSRILRGRQAEGLERPPLHASYNMYVINMKYVIVSIN